MNYLKIIEIFKKIWRKNDCPKILLEHFIIVGLFVLLMIQIFSGSYFQKRTVEKKPTMKIQKELPDVEEYRKQAEKKKKLVAFTFDDGPNPINTKRILEILSKHDAHATFFVVGTNAKQYPEILKAIVQSGSEVGNHTHHHRKLTKLNQKEVLKEIIYVDRVVKKATGKKTKFLRPPYGAYNQELLSIAKKPVILWNLDTLDWESRNTDQIVKTVLENIQDGDIVLMHDLYDTTVQAVAILVPKLKAEGFEIVSVSSLAKSKESTLKKGKVYGGFKNRNK